MDSQDDGEQRQQHSPSDDINSTYSNSNSIISKDDNIKRRSSPFFCDSIRMMLCESASSSSLSSPASKRIRRWLNTIKILLVLFFVTLAILLSNKNGSNDISNVRSPKSIYIERYVYIRTTISRLRHSNADPTIFINPKSPQSEALQWLVYQDETIAIGSDDQNDDEKEEGIANINVVDNHNSISNYGRLVQRYVLLLLAFATGYDQWSIFLEDELWVNLPAVNECSFRGIECDDQGEVTAMDLRSCKLTGTIPQELSLLTKLTYLDLASNRLKGTIPNALFLHLTNLELLALESNEFVFGLSSDIGKLSNLKTFTIHTNRLSGTIPVSMTNLSELKIVEANGNRLSGLLLDMALHWPKLEVLIASDSLISGTVPTEVSSLTNLQKFEVFRTNVEGTIPSEIGLLTNLESLQFAWDVGGSIPDMFSDLSLLKKIYLFGELFTGTIPMSITTIAGLEEFYIWRVNIEGTIPSEFGRLTSLKMLHLQASRISGTIPSELGNLRNLEDLIIYDTYLTGSVPVELCDRIEDPDLPQLLPQGFIQLGLLCDCCDQAWNRP